MPLPAGDIYNAFGQRSFHKYSNRSDQGPLRCQAHICGFESAAGFCNVIHETVFFPVNGSTVAEIGFHTDPPFTDKYIECLFIKYGLMLVIYSWNIGKLF